MGSVTSMGVGLAVCWLAGAATAAAQAPAAATIAVGYSALHELTSGATYGRGWIVAVVGRPAPRLGLVGELGGDYRTPAGVPQRLHSALGGIRWDVRAGGRIAPFLQVLAGWEHYGEPGFTENGAALQPGAGLDVWLARRIGARVQADARFVRTGRETVREARIATSLVVAIGGP